MPGWAGVRTSASYTITVDTADGGGAAVATADYAMAWSAEVGSVGTSVSGDYLLEHGFVTGEADPPPPTAARLAEFEAVRQEARVIAVTWLTLTEFDVLAFRVERSADGVAWAALPGGDLPATGGTLPRRYRVIDADNPGGAGWTYRLVEFDLHGSARVAAQAMVTGAPELSLQRREGAWWLTVTATPRKQYHVESARVLGGIWLPEGMVTTDDRGVVRLNLGLGEGVNGQFFRVRAAD